METASAIYGNGINCSGEDLAWIYQLNNLEPELPVLRLIQLTEGFKSHVIDTD
jgi:hypothetical protein